MPKAVALEIGFFVVGVVRLQWSESKLAIQGPHVLISYISLFLLSAHSASWERGNGDGYGVGCLRGTGISPSSLR